MSNVRASKDDMSERQSGRTPAEEAELQQAIASLNLDVVRELQTFRQWQHSGDSQPMTPLRATNARSRVPIASSPTSSVQAKPQPQPTPQAEPEPAHQPAAIVEDLDEEWVDEGGFPIPIPLALAGVTLAAVMAGMGVSWFASWLLPGAPPSEPSPATAQQASAESQSDVGEPLEIDLDALSLIPVDPEADVRVRSPQRLGEEFDTLARSEFDLTIPDYRPSELFEAATLPAVRPAFDSPELDIRPAANSGALITAAPNLGTQLGEGTYYVLMDYQGDRSLELARDIEPTAFVKRFGDRTYIQIATFQQLEYARHMADTLSQQGYETTISQ